VFVNLRQYCRKGWSEKIKLQTRSYLRQILMDLFYRFIIFHKVV